jgi:LAO/AO transport system kinase
MTAIAVSAADAALIEQALQHKKVAVSRLISLFEDTRETEIARRTAVYEALSARTGDRCGAVVGITGTPGSGKSSLLSRVTLAMIEADPKLSVAVLAVDPSSEISGGALLGDRTRMRLPHSDERLFFRSQASQAQLGGLGPSSFQVVRLLAQLFDCVLVETVGIGQSETDIRRLADRVFLVLAPLGGDEVQFLKAGIMEVPHAFILNKSDEPTAKRSYHTLRQSLSLARPFDAEKVPLYRTSARTGEGIDKLTAAMLDVIKAPAPRDMHAREPYFFLQWVKEEWGRFGAELLETQLGGAAAFLRGNGGFDRAQPAFGARVRQALGANA